jgi:hypothetical protein
MPAQWNLIDDLESPRVSDVEGTLRFASDIDSAAVGRGYYAVVYFDPCDFSHNFIRDWIDNLNVIAGAVGLEDSNHFVRGGLQGQEARKGQKQNGKAQTPKMFTRHGNQLLLPSNKSRPLPIAI